MRCLRPGLSCAALMCVLATILSAQTPGMPDPRQMSGVPLRVSDIPLGTVTVRVIRGTLANNMPGQAVELLGDGAPRRATTNETGRVEFSGLRPGARVKAVAAVAGERLESQEFVVPDAGGVRMLLVASGDAASTSGPVPADPTATGEGGVRLGQGSRFVFEIGDAALNVFSILQIVNASSAPVALREPVVFEAAANGGDVTLLQGSSPRARAEGRRVSVAGPFPPGTTAVQFAYAVPYDGPVVTIEQRMPVVLEQVTMMAQKVGDMTVTSPHVVQRREMPAQGEIYIVGQGPGVRAGEPVTFSFAGLPHAAAWPRHLALALAGVILAGGALLGRARPRDVAAEDRAALEARRERLFAELADSERRQRGGALAPADAARRRELIAELESIYAALDN